ncbi:hypothetical protein PLESTB_000828200 [Pleodorina starrii]|uniref:Progesterone-induced-blocking factor 1 n=1 Tax=Pleodorina starrii TaxID=330485 RepID=A0A9W6BLS4_9CHLO|nr:hypothetical protein PLESTM_000143700 [Pleodorina starrii]GLC54140.1 hypothetical protein PLESTB_000828200 [Pleodorina starrii]GLC64556.1 hypothetical protein PLESTF_000178400 [Pleodorina starrii]
MATKVKSKIQRLLRQLDHDDDSLPGDDDAGALRTAAVEEQAENLAALASARRAAAALDSSTPGSMSSLGGASDSTGLLTGLSSSETHLPQDDSESLAPSSLESTPLQRPSRLSHQHHRRNDYAAAGHAERVAVLERKLMSLMAENRTMQAAFSEAMARKNAEVAELQAHLGGTVREMSARQQELEAAAPLLRMRLEDFRAQLADLRVSDAAYQELRTLPRDSRTALDEVRIAVHEAMAESKSEAEMLRTTLSGAREAGARAEEAAARARMEAARHAAALAEREKDLALVTEGMQARIDRLASELESAMVSAQLSSAKGALYDELRAKYDAAISENQRLAVVEATFKKLEAQAARDRSTATQKEHTFEMLMMDKAYLTKQVDFLADQQRKMEAELELREKKITELSRQKSELYEKLMAAETLKGRNEEARLQKELAALQERTHADLEKIRVETAEAYEREARLLRELRDSAQEDALRAKAALAELQVLHEKTNLAHAEVARRMEQQVVALQTELKQKSFELSHFKVVVTEKEQLVGRTNMQNELLQDKLSVLMDKYRALEVEHNTHLHKALAAAAETVAAAAASGGGGGGGGSTGGAEVHPADALAIITSGAATAATAPAKLQVELALLKQERDALTREVEHLSGRLAAAHDSLRLASQPHAFLLEELEAVKLRASQAETKMAALQVALTARSNEVEALTAERDALRSDLDGLLAQRQALEGMKAVVVKALAGGLPQVQQAAAAAAVARKPAPPLSSTTIIGEGGLPPAPPLPTHQPPPQRR